MTSGPTGPSTPEPTPGSKPEEPVVVSTPAPTPGGAFVVGNSSTAEAYITQELARTRASLRRTQIGGIVFLLLVGGILAYITSGFLQSFQPHAAAEIADGLIMQQINDNGPQLSEQIKEQIPQYIEKTPDYALEELPKYRQELADRVEADLTKYCQSTSTQLGQHLDTFLTDHKDDVNGLLTSGNDPATVKKASEDLKQQLMAYIQEQPVNGGESVSTQINKSLQSLQDVAKTMHHLAHDTNLTPDEKKARRAIAILTHNIDLQKQKLMPADASVIPTAPVPAP